MKRTYDDTEVLASFRKHLEAIAPMTDAVWSVLTEAMRVEPIRRGAMFLEEGTVCRHIWFVYRGSARALHLKAEAEITTALYTEGVCLTNMKSLVSGAPSHLFLQALEDAVLVKMSKESLIRLYATEPALERVGRLILEQLLAEESDWKEMYTLYGAEERYRFLLQKAPQYLQRIPLQHIASFLGIRRETLSRIRAKAARPSL